MIKSNSFFFTFIYLFIFYHLHNRNGDWQLRCLPSCKSELSIQVCVCVSQQVWLARPVCCQEIRLCQSYQFRVKDINQEWTPIAAAAPAALWMADEYMKRDGWKHYNSSLQKHKTRIEREYSPAQAGIQNLWPRWEYRHFD